MRKGSRLQIYLDAGILGPLLGIVFRIVVGIHLEVVKLKLFSDPLFERLALFQCHRIGLGDDGNNVDDIGQLLQDDNINWLQTVTVSK